MEFVQENWVGIAGGIGFLLLLSYVWKALTSKKEVIGETMKLNVRCRKCNWQGVVTKYNQVCSKCASADLEQL